MARRAMMWTARHAGDASALSVVRPWLTSEEQELRHAATDALRLMPGGEVDALLAERLESDKVVAVRMSVTSAALVRDRSPLLERAMVRAALEDENSGVRKNAVRAIGQWLADSPALRKPLERVASEDENDAVKAFARAALER